MPSFPSPSVPSFRAVRTVSLGVLALVASVAGCECGGRQIDPNGARLIVDWVRGPDDLVAVPPEAIAVEGIPGRPVLVTLKVSNKGKNELLFTETPKFLDGFLAPQPEFTIVEQFAINCDETERPADKRGALQSDDCAYFRFAYLPTSDGLDSAILRFVSNDDSLTDGLLDITINGDSKTPDLQVCAFDGETLIDCSQPGSNAESPYEVFFGDVEVDRSSTRRLELRSKGSRPLAIDGLSLSGDVDFTTNPADLRESVPSGEKRDVTVTFNAKAGNAREGRLVIDSNDPAETKLYVRLVGTGDGPALCTAVANTDAGQTCTSPGLRPAIVADFGEVGLGSTGKRTLCLRSCGSKPMPLNAIRLEGNPPYTMTAPATGGSLAVGQVAEVPLTFTPATADRFEGRVVIDTGAVPLTVLLKGEGVVSGCQLQAGSPVLDFGQVAQTIQSKRQYAVSNSGTAACEITGVPRITAGANVTFEVVGVPANPLVMPGGSLRFEIGYTPQDVTGPDVGELTIDYKDAENQAPGSIAVRLQGTPTAEPKCVLVAQPGTSGLFGRALNFGQVRINTDKLLPITFQNTGSIPCTIGPGSIPPTPAFPPGMPDDASAFRVVTQPKSPLNPGETTTAELKFTPASDRAYGSPLQGVPFPGPVPGSVKVSFNTSDQASFNGQSCGGTGFPPTTGAPGCVAWDLSGEGVKSNLYVLPADVDFGLVTLGCRSREQLVTLYNVGAASMEIKSIRVDPNTSTFIVNAPATPFTLSGGQSRQISVRYRPPDVQVHTGTIYIESDATNTSTANPFVTIGLRGEGTTESRQTDTFDQNSRPKSDVLFIVDNSGSMSEEQSALGNNASRFMGVATTLNTDYQVGVITTDMDDDGQAGRLQGGATDKIIKPGANAASTFANRVRNLGTNGSGDERGLEAMVAALTPPLSADPAFNAGFLRQDAKLAVVVVSDEEDSSNGNTAFYIDFLRNLKGAYNSALVTLSAIVGDDPNGCTSSNGDATAGSRYIAVQQATQGKFRSICVADWGQIAADLGLDAFGARSGFQLSRAADPSKPMTVTVNGTASVPPAWSYEAPANTVVFSPTPPPPGSTVVISYEAACY